MIEATVRGFKEYMQSFRSSVLLRNVRALMACGVRDLFENEGSSRMSFDCLVGA